MALPLKHRVQMALEVTRGTAVAPTTLEMPIMGDGMKATIVDATGKIIASSTWPYATDEVPVGVYCSGITMRVEANRDNIRDLILLATKRTSGNLPSVTIVHDQSGVGVARYSGCVCRSITLEFSRGATPGDDNLLAVNMEFDCMKAENGQGAIAALTPASARRFQIRKGTYTVNAVSATETSSLRIAVTNQLALGPVDGSDKRLYIEDGEEMNEIATTQRFTTTAWRALVEGSTEFAASFVLATGTANETVTATIAKAQGGARELGELDGVVTEQIGLKAFYGAAAPVVWTFGSAIGLTVLGL